MPMLLVLATTLVLLYQAEKKVLIATSEADQQHIVELGILQIRSQLSMLQGDLLYLANNPTLLRWLNTKDSADRRVFSNDLIVFAKHKGIYDQLRYINNDGKEVIRINWNNGHPEAASNSQLQDKRNRYYVQKGLQLKKDGVLISKFDLNVEHGIVEQPAKPMIRLITPVLNERNKQEGLLVLNYLGQNILENLKAIDANNVYSLWLINNDGYWIHGVDHDKKWRFMLQDDRPDIQFSTQYNTAWERISKFDRGIVNNEKGKFIYSYIKINDKLPVEFSEDWILISFDRPDRIEALLAEHRNKLIILFIALTILLAGISWVFSHKGALHQEIELDLKESRR